MNNATKKAIKGIEAIPAPTSKNVSTVTVSFKPGNYDLAVAFAKWLGEQTEAKVHIGKQTEFVVTFEA